MYFFLFDRLEKYLWENNLVSRVSGSFMDSWYVVRCRQNMPKTVTPSSTATATSSFCVATVKKNHFLSIAKILSGFVHVSLLYGE